MTLVNTSRKASLNVNNFNIKFKKHQFKKFLGAHADSNLASHRHMSDLHRKAGRKVNVVIQTPIKKNLSKRRLLMTFLFKTHFNYGHFI